jgi:signal transduction histidine kinase
MARRRVLSLRARVLVLVAVTAAVPVVLVASFAAGRPPLAPWQAAGLLAVHLGFSAALAWGAARSVTRPLDRLGEEAERIAGGALDAPVADVGRDEVGRLGRALERMRAGLLDHVALEREHARLAALEEARAARLREVLEAQEGERRRVARELHDETAQGLAALALGLDRAGEVLRGGGDPGPALAEARALALRTLEEIQCIVRDLRPAALDDLGLASAIRALAERELGGRGVAARVEIGDGLEAGLAPEVETAVFRMVQEAIGNAGRHAQASHVLVELDLRGGEVVASVEDDGVGFEASPGARRSGFGLLGLRERAELLGGSVAITSAPGEGTRVEITLPLERAGEERGAGAGEGR